MKQAVKPTLRAGLWLAGFGALASALLAGTYALTRDQIAASTQARLLRELSAVLPPERYNNALSTDTQVVNEAALGGSSTIYRARQDGQPVALILSVKALDGYSGAIDLLVGVDRNGRLTGVRVTQHRETPGLGDKIELRKSDWILDFDGRSLDNPALAQWTVRKDGGVFDQFTGATITPRAIVKALSWVADHRAELFETSAAATDTPPSEAAAP
jgi:Na+-translocating ferredoxin:NAD+ oxidoreductase subunit G